MFIDFCRDQLGSSKEFSGSLFSHQELAISSYLDKEFLAFQEKGVRKLEGLIGHLQANCIEFTDRSALPHLVEEQVRSRQWQSNWRNQLVISLNDPPYDDAHRLPEDVDGRFYHSRVSNRHHYQTARDCMGYVYAVRDHSTGANVPFETVELKWAGHQFPAATIAPSSFRRLDAFWLPHPAPTELQFNCFADSPRFIPAVRGEGEWSITYQVLSSTVPGDSCSIRIRLNRHIARVVVSDDDI